MHKAQTFPVWALLLSKVYVSLDNSFLRYGKIYFRDRRRRLRSGQRHHRRLSGPTAEVPRPQGGQPEAGPLRERGPGYHEPPAARRGLRHRRRHRDRPGPGPLRAFYR